MIIAVDTGGTKTLVVVFDNDMTIVKSVKFTTPQDYDSYLEEMRSVAASLPLDKVTNGAIGIRGVIDRKTGELVLDSVLTWTNTPIVRDCEAIFGCPFVIENDSKLAGLSEARAVDSKYRKVVYVTVSTGIGSALVVDGKLDDATIESEVGNWVFSVDGRLQVWEDFASGSWIKATYGKLASELDDIEAWKTISSRLALGFVNICAAYTPDLIVIGGGVGSHFAKFDTLLKDAVSRMASPSVKVCPIIQAKHPEEAVIYGCYYYAVDALTAQTT